MKKWNAATAGQQSAYINWAVANGGNLMHTSLTIVKRQIFSTDLQLLIW